MRGELREALYEAMLRFVKTQVMNAKWSTDEDEPVKVIGYEYDDGDRYAGDDEYVELPETTITYIAKNGGKRIWSDYKNRNFEELAADLMDEEEK